MSVRHDTPQPPPPTGGFSDSQGSVHGMQVWADPAVPGAAEQPSMATAAPLDFPGQVRG